MRKKSTDVERKLWSLLRSRQLSNFRFRRQQPIAGYIVDFVCMSENLVIELDGGQHGDPEQATYDAERSKKLSVLNFRVLRFTDYEMLRDPDAVLNTIHRHLTDDNPSP